MAQLKCRCSSSRLKPVKEAWNCKWTVVMKNGFWENGKKILLFVMARFEICWFSLGGGGAKLTFADSRQVGSHLSLGEQVIQIIKHQQVVGIIIIAMLLMMLLQIMMMMTNCWLFYKSKFVQDTEWADSITGALSAIIVNLFEVQLKIKAIYIYYLAVRFLSLKKGKRSN